MENHNKKKSHERFLWVDIIKGVCIIAVVLSHCAHPFKNYTMLPIRGLLYEVWFVPVFFVVAGFFMKYDKLSHPLPFIKGKMNSLYRLLLYFYIPVVLLHNVFLNIGFYDTVTEYGGKFMSYYSIGDFAKSLLLSIAFAGREPILGAMWFVYVLLLAFITMTLLTLMIRCFVKDERRSMIALGLCLVALAIASCQLTNIIGFTIPRCNNVFTTMWLIFIGYLIKNKANWKFNNNALLCLSVLIIYHIASITGGANLAANKYSDILTLTAGSVSALYIIAFIAQKIERTKIGKFLAKCGNDSFYIMGLHFAGFKICTLVLGLFGIEKSLASLIAPANGSLLMTGIYLLFGVYFPLVFMFLFRKIKGCLWHR